MIVEEKLAELMGLPEITEARALDYYLKEVKGEVKDIFGRQILLGDEVFDSLFKDPFTGKKIKEPGNFENSRAKRLPWIRYVLSTSKQVYVVNEPDWITYYYTMPFQLKYRKENTGDFETAIDHYLIVTKKKAGEKIKFITAYVPENRLDLFKKICRGAPYCYEP